jgi:hypothetical protein
LRLIPIPVQPGAQRLDALQFLALRHLQPVFGLPGLTLLFSLLSLP